MMVDPRVAGDMTSFLRAIRRIELAFLTTWTPTGHVVYTGDRMTNRKVKLRR